MTVEMLQQIVNTITQCFSIAFPFALIFMICQKVSNIMIAFIAGKSVRF